MKHYKILIILIGLLLTSNTVEAQGLFSIRSSRGDRSNSMIKSRTNVVTITDLNSLKDVPSIASQNWLDYRGIIAYNPKNYPKGNAKISEGFYVWDGAQWLNIYSPHTSLAGSLRGDLEALYAMQHHPDNDRLKDMKGYHKWDIDLKNIDNPKNLKLSGVFFREINGEQRVIELNLEDFNFENITLTQGLEALVAFKIYYTDKAKVVNLKLPNLVNYVSDRNSSLVKTNLDCPNLAFIQSKRNRKETTLDVSKCPRLSTLNIFETRISNLDISKNKELKYLECSLSALSNLDLSHNRKLIRLSCHTNFLTALDVSNNIALTEIFCSINKIETLNLSKNRELQILKCDQNLLKELDVSNNERLIELDCNYNSLEMLDLSKNVALTILEASINRSLESLNISNCLELTRLMVSETKLTSLDLSHHTKLNTLDIYYCPLISIPHSIKICKHSFMKVLENSHKGLHMHEKDSNIYNLVDCE